MIEKIPNKYSKFWLSNHYIRSMFDPMASENEETVAHTMVLAEYRRAIANFVKIVTGKDLPVIFNTDSDESLTTGNLVVISAEMHEDSLDSTVGLALHEATHITESDMVFFSPDKLKPYIPSNVLVQANTLGCNEEQTVDYVKHLTNWVEDNRIDAIQYKNAPGYRGYYLAMMDRCFNSETIVEGLKDEKVYRDETVDAYFFRVINLVNPASDLKALKGLEEIAKIVDLKNIMRLKNTKEAFFIALEIFKIMLKHVDFAKKSKEKQEGLKKKGLGSLGGGSGSPDTGDNKDKKKVLIKNAPFSSGEPAENDGKEPDEVIDFNDLSETQQELMKALAKEIEKQKKFLAGNTEKKPMDKNEANRLDILGETGSSLNAVPFYPDEYHKQEFNVIVLRSVTSAVFDSDIFPFKGDTKGHENDVIKGIVLGTMLGRKLQVRNEERATMYPRKHSGHIEQRLLAELGFDNANIFQQTFIEKFSKAILHISIDISGSMGMADKLNRCIVASVAIAKAATMIQNLDIIISLRGTSNDYPGLPLVAIMYDSRKDKFTKIREQFPWLIAPSSTPEGLCYAAIQNEIVSSSKNIRSYFLNLSDGEPCYTGYSGKPAALHTKGEVEKMRARGIKILSYFITDNSYYDKDGKSNFNIMYGRDAKEINVENIVDLARTLNEMFTSDEQKITITT